MKLQINIYLKIPQQWQSVQTVCIVRKDLCPDEGVKQITKKMVQLNNNTMRAQP